MDFGITLGIGGVTVLLVGAIVIGLGTYFIGQVESSYQWIVTGTAAFIGGLVASEWIVGLRGFEPVWDGLALLPALVGAIVVGGIVDLGLRVLTGGAARHGPMSA